jgi:chemotaxis response regulator CheB
MSAVNGDRGTSPAAEPDAAASTRAVLATSDPLFAALCQRALAGTSLKLLAAVPPSELLETVRRLAPDLLVLDVDGEETGALKALATKVTLVSEAHIVLVSAYLAPGSPGLSALLQSIAATFVQKPEGPSSLGLADGDPPPFVAALGAALAAHDEGSLDGNARQPSILPVDFDSGWDIEEEPPGRGSASRS